MGIEEASNESLGLYADGSYIDHSVEFFSDVPPGQERTVHTFHQFYTTRDEYIIDIWFDLLAIDNSLKDQILASVDIPEINRIRGGNDAYENTIPSDMIDAPLFSISKLPDGYTRDFLSSDCALIIRKDFVVAGVNVFPIPQDVYDPIDKSFQWLEKMGLADFEDPELCYMGGITSGDNGWAAEFASDVPDGTPARVHRRHTYRVIGSNLYDIWTDLTLLDYHEAQEITAAVQLPQLAETEEKQVDRSAEEIAFEKTAAIMDAIADGSSGILQKQIQDSNEGPKAYERKYYFHDGNLLHTSTMLPEGVNQTEAGDYYNRYAFLYVNEEAYDNTGHQGEPGDIIWSSAQIPDVFPTPWLGNHIWNKSYVTYIDTMEVEEGECLMFRYDAMYADIEGYAPVYWVNFYFDHNGRFLYVSMDVNLFQNNAFTITESILTMDPAAVEAEIHKEYQRAINK